MLKAYYIPSGPKNLSDLFSTSFEDGEEYYLEIKNFSGDTVATTPVFKVVECCNDDKIRVHFLNSLGTVDAITFKNLTTTFGTKSDLMQTPTKYPLVKEKHSFNRFNVKANDTLTLLNIDYDRPAMEWIKELIASPVAWIERTDYYVPIVIQDITAFPLRKEDPQDQYRYEVQMQVTFSHERFVIRN